MPRGTTTRVATKSGNFILDMISTDDVILMSWGTWRLGDEVPRLGQRFDIENLEKKGSMLREA